MKDAFTILIADRNSHVRTFLMRELMAEGYRVKLAATGEDLLNLVFARGEDIDLLILDPDLPGVEAGSIFKRLGDRIPALPMVLHTHRQHDEDFVHLDTNWFTVIEKAGDSVVRIKEAVDMHLPRRRRAVSDAIRAADRKGEIREITKD